MEILRAASCGSLASSDVMIEIEPRDKGLQLELQSPVKEQFGEVIEQLVLKILKEEGVHNLHLRITDQGALDCTLEARLRTVLRRGAGQ